MTARTQPYNDFDLIGHVMEMLDSPGKEFKATRLGKKAAGWIGSSKHLLLAVAVLETLKTCQDKASQEVLFNTLAVLLHRDLPFADNHLDLLFRALDEIESVQELMQILPQMLGAIERTAGLEPLTPPHQQVLETFKVDSRRRIRNTGRMRRN